MAMLEPEQRKRALWQGVLSAFAAPAWFIATARSITHFPNPAEWLQRVAILILFLIGLVVAIFSIWRLSVARDRRWDARGTIALCLMLVPGLPTLFLFLFVLVSIFAGPVFGP
jgi:predicted tellurium resistance membrane protein TerC